MPSDVKLIMHSLKCDITTGTVGERGKQLNYFLPSKFNFFLHFILSSISPAIRSLFQILLLFSACSLFFKGQATQRFHFY